MGLAAAIRCGFVLPALTAGRLTWLCCITEALQGVLLEWEKSLPLGFRRLWKG